MEMSGGKQAVSEFYDPNSLMPARPNRARSERSNRCGHAPLRGIHSAQQRGAMA